MKNVLLFGSTGYVGTHFIERNIKKYNIIEVGRREFDFLDPDIDSLVKSLRNTKFDAVVFLQGINPCNGVDDITEEQFFNMLKINITTPHEIIRSINPWISYEGSVVFMSSIARKKGSYDPSYATSKAGLVGLQQTMSNAFPFLRFNTVSLGLVKNSTVHRSMTDDFEKKHIDAMGGKLVHVDDACKAIEFLIECNSVNRSIVSVDRGFKL